jgi:hypothetical protein
MAGMPLANAGKWANAALSTTLKAALKAPRIRKTREEAMLDPGDKFDEDQTKQALSPRLDADQVQSDRSVHSEALNPSKDLP